MDFCIHIFVCIYLFFFFLFFYYLFLCVYISKHRHSTGTEPNLQTKIKTHLIFSALLSKKSITEQIKTHQLVSKTR